MRKMIAVWLFQIIFYFVIFVGEYNNKLSDKTQVGNFEWENIRVSAMSREFQDQEWFVSTQLKVLTI